MRQLYNGATVSTAVITVIVLIFGEITPKSLAKESPESFASFSAPIINFIRIILTPVNWLFSQWKKLVSKMFKSKDDRTLTEEELLSLVEEVEHSGGIGEQESELITPPRRKFPPPLRKADILVFPFTRKPSTA